MAKLALLFWLTATATVFAAPAEVFSLFDSRACTTPSNSLKNPSFESNGLSSWVFKPTHAKLGSAAVVTSGYKSDHAVQVGATSGSEDPTSYNKLQQTFKTCKASTFQLSWSMYLPKDGAQYTAPRTPGMAVNAIAPDGGPFKVGEWVNLIADFPNSKTGTWTISMEWYAYTPVSGGKTSKLNLKLDNFAVKLR
ncbi:hypothetical protein FGRMN_5241 [Fusarium graminum]|nr:hypothetical protein FGRMN_5241 [Fusarium graminum]